MNAGSVRERLINGALVVVALSAVTTTSLAAYRTFYPSAPKPLPAAVAISDWKSFASAGHRFGSDTAPVTIVEFSDFQCPFCRRAAKTLAAARQKYPGQVAVVYRHYPLERIHPLARKAALASECAARQGRFEAYHDALFASDSLEGGMWIPTAAKVGVPKARDFARCLDDANAGIAIDRDVLEGTKLKIDGTPTILINQYRLTGGGAADVVDSLIKVILRGR